MIPISNQFSGTTSRIFTKLSGLVELCKGLINFSFIWRLLKGPRQPISRKIGKIFIVALPFQNELGYQNADGLLKSMLNVAKSCKNFVRFSAVTLEKLFLIFVLVWKNGHIQLDLGVDFESRLKSTWGFWVRSGRFHLGSESNFIGVLCFFQVDFLTLFYDCFVCKWIKKSVFVRVDGDCVYMFKKLHDFVGPMQWSEFRFPNQPSSAGKEVRQLKLFRTCLVCTMHFR